MIHSNLGSFFYYLIRFICLIAIFQSCTAPKRYQAGKPFVYKNTITIDAHLPKDQKNALETRLRGQLDDSLKLRIKTYAGLYRELIHPPAFDTFSIARSKQFMNALLYTEGYFRSKILDSSVINVYPNTFTEKITNAFAYVLSSKNNKQKQQRVHNYFKVQTGPALVIENITYALSDSTLQELAVSSEKRAHIQKGQNFKQQMIASELERLSDVFRNNGYFKFSADDLYAEADTIDLSLLVMDNDPFDQLNLLAEAKKRQDSPTVKLTIKLRPVTDSSILEKYYIGEIRIFPDMKIGDSTQLTSLNHTVYNEIDIYYNEEKFKPSFLANQPRIEKDSLFKQYKYVRTVNAFNQLEAWQQVNVEAVSIRKDSVPYINFDIKLFNSPKQSLIFELESSRNTGSDAFSSGNLLGLGVNVGIRNKNVAREAIQSITQLRAGIELNPERGANFILTRQVSFSHNYSIPKLFIPFYKPGNNFRTARTIINTSAGYTERKDIFNLGTINTSIGYEWSKRMSANSSKVFLFRPFNIELNKLTRKPGLDSLFLDNPILQYNFSDGLIIGSGFSYILSTRVGNRVNFLKASLEESGGVAGALFKGLYNDLYRFVKLDAEYKHFIERNKSTWAFRVMAGYGYAYGKNNNKSIVLPFFRQYFAGGPNSMRAWAVRSLGPGSIGINDSVYNSTTPQNLRLGDVQLEANIEYRFNLAVIWGIKLKSALFADIGNVWYGPNIFKKAHLPATYPLDFNLKRLYKDIAIAGGTSLRLDFDYFLIRLDWAYKLKDPYFAAFNNGWTNAFQLRSGQLQLGIGYPF